MGLEWFALPQMCAAAGGATRLALGMAEALAAHPDRIAATFAADRGLMLAEAAVFALAERMPRPEAQALVAEAVGRRRRRHPRRGARRAGARHRLAGGARPAPAHRRRPGARRPAARRRGRRAGVAEAPPPRPPRLPAASRAGVKAGEAAAEGRSALTPAQLADPTMEEAPDEAAASSAPRCRIFLPSSSSLTPETRAAARSAARARRRHRRNACAPLRRNRPVPPAGRCRPGERFG